MKPRISVITLGVADLERATSFYLEGLGFPLKEAKPALTYLKLPGTWLALVEHKTLSEYALLPEAESATNSVLLSWNVDSAEEVEAVLAKAQQAGGTVTKPTAEMSWGGVAGFFSDLDGHNWEIVWNPKADELFSEPA